MSTLSEVMFHFHFYIMYFVLSFFLSLFLKILFIFIDRKREGEKHQCARETWISCHMLAPSLGPDLQTRRAPWPGINRTFAFCDDVQPTEPHWLGFSSFSDSHASILSIIFKVTTLLLLLYFCWFSILLVCVLIFLNLIPLPGYLLFSIF